jgi:hypothetical protein
MASKNKGGREVRKEKKDAKPKGQPLTSSIPTSGPTKSGGSGPKH